MHLCHLTVCLYTRHSRHFIIDTELVYYTFMTVHTPKIVTLRHLSMSHRISIVVCMKCTHTVCSTNARKQTHIPIRIALVIQNYTHLIIFFYKLKL